MYSVTCVAPVNIALIKYWGKRDEELILPINSSISVTLGTEEMCATTTITACESFNRNRIWLNGEEQTFVSNARLMRCVKKVQGLALASGNLKFSIGWKLHIVSRNNFPTAAGLASSAAGYACLVYALSKLYGLTNDIELSSIARLGSGSACRSMYGGFVKWQMGDHADGNDSYAVQIASPRQWPNIHVFILVVSDTRKKTSSTEGMRRSMKTSTLLAQRTTNDVNNNIKSIEKAIKMRDFATLARITMRDSNQFHAITLDTYPPCIYLNDTSKAIIAFVHEYNELLNEEQLAYTFDAGPNACLLMQSKDVAKVMKAIEHAFPNDAAESVEYTQGLPIDCSLTDCNKDFNYAKLTTNSRNLLKFIIHTKIGDGPSELIGEQNNFVDANTGLPRVC